MYYTYVHTYICSMLRGRIKGKSVRTSWNITYIRIRIHTVLVLEGYVFILFENLYMDVHTYVCMFISTVYSHTYFTQTKLLIIHKAALTCLQYVHMHVCSLCKVEP